MTDALHPQHTVGDMDLALTVPADPAAASQVTAQVGSWLGRSVHIDTERTSDIVLAAYEALANCADHAYRGAANSGLMTLEATYDWSTQTVRICVTDRGHWTDPAANPVNVARGRGLRLMKALCDNLIVNGTESGTTVCLHFERCPDTTGLR